MDGVQFVLHNPVYETVYSWGFSWAGLIFLGLVIIALICFYDMCKSKDFIGVIPIIIMFIFSALFSYAVFSTGTETEVYSHSEYQVVIHEGVDCKEFLERYEVLEVNGDLYTIKERDKTE